MVANLYSTATVIHDPKIGILPENSIVLPNITRRLDRSMTTAIHVVEEDFASGGKKTIKLIIPLTGTELVPPVVVSFAALPFEIDIDTVMDSVNVFVSFLNEAQMSIISFNNLQNIDTPIANGKTQILLLVMIDNKGTGLFLNKLHARPMTFEPGKEITTPVVFTTTDPPVFSQFVPLQYLPGGKVKGIFFLVTAQTP